MKIKLSKNQWEKMGKEAGWITAATSVDRYMSAFGDMLKVIGSMDREKADQLEAETQSLAQAFQLLKSFQAELRNRVLANSPAISGQRNTAQDINP
jgi:hypothetical protein